MLFLRILNDREDEDMLNTVFVFLSESTNQSLQTQNDTFPQ